jgi:anti-sigma regulatory factor (Ser/Thr protein kinase)
MGRGDEPFGVRYGDRAGETSTVYHARVPAASDELTGLRHGLTSWLRRHRFPADTVQSIELACYEAMANVAEHAYGGGDGELRLTATARPDRLDVVVSDRGRWRDEHDGKRYASGMGITLIRRLADQADIETDRSGTVVSMTWFRPGFGPSGN